MPFNVPDFIKFMVFILVVLVASPPCLYEGDKEYRLQVVLCASIEYMGDMFHQHVCHSTGSDKLWGILVGPAAGSLPLFSQRWNVPYPNSGHLLHDADSGTFRSCMGKSSSSVRCETIHD